MISHYHETDASRYCSVGNGPEKPGEKAREIGKHRQAHVDNSLNENSYKSTGPVVT